MRGQSQKLALSPLFINFAAMNVESIREYCLSLPLATEDIPFDFNDYGGIVGFRVLGKIFAMIDLDNTEWFVLKCDPDRAIQLREQYGEITPAWHMNKKYWNQVNMFGLLNDDLIMQLVRHSYAEVVKKMTLKARREHPEITQITEQ